MRVQRALTRWVPMGAVFCLNLLMVSCQPALLTRPTCQAGSADPVQCSFSASAIPTDHEPFIRANAAAALEYHRYQPVTRVVGKRSLTLDDCRNIALTNNLEVHVARIEELTKAAVAESHKTKALPRLLVYADLIQRDNQLYVYSDVLGQEGRTPRTGAVDGGVTDYYTSQERSIGRYVLETRWNLTDAALAYFLSKSSSNDRLKSHYQKVRVAQKMISAVDQAYFRLLGLQKSLPVAEELVSIRSKLSKEMKQSADRGVVGITEYEKARQQELRAGRALSKIRNETEKQRNILASLLGLSPDRHVDGGFRVTGDLSVPSFQAPISDLEMQAVHNRPEAFEAGLTHINSTNELQSAMVKSFPKVTVYWKHTQDKDKYLYRKDWRDVGVYVYFDLMEWWENRSENKAAKAQVAGTHAKLGVVALGIASQVRVAALDYSEALAELKAVQGILESADRVRRTAKQKPPKDDIERIIAGDAKAAVLQDILERNKMLGEVNARLSELLGVLGTNYQEPVPTG